MNSDREQFLEFKRFHKPMMVGGIKGGLPAVGVGKVRIADRNGSTKVDRTTSNYTLDIPNSKRFNTFHIDSIKKYTDPHLELFPNRQRRQPRVVQAEEDLNLEIEKVIGHERRRNGNIRFLCKWEGFPNEDSTYRAAEDFKSSPYGIKVVKDYLLSFGETPDDLREWMDRTDWIRDVIREAQEVSNEGSQGA